MKKIFFKNQMFFILLIPFTILISLVAKNYPYIVEKFYSSLFYKILIYPLSTVTGLLPISIAELIIISLVIFVIFYISKTCIKFFKFKKNRSKILKKTSLNFLGLLGIIYFLFQILWGINYNRLSFAQIYNFKVTASSTKELTSLCENLIVQSNNLRHKLHQDRNGVMHIPYDKGRVLSNAKLGYNKASLTYPKLDGNYGNPKKILLSKPMCYTGISGFYFAYTGEANVNMAIPDAFLPCTVTHEMAHQRGFAKENEANYIAYVTCINNPDMYFKYSGTLLALVCSMNALYVNDVSKYNELVSTYSTGVLNDVKYNSKFWRKYSGPIEKISDKVNDTYLKSQNQKLGVKSYGAMVDLLLAERRVKN